MSPNSDTPPFARVYSRRKLGQAAAGILLFFSMNPCAALGQIASGKLPIDLETNKRLESWLRINADGTVEVFTGKVEFGQGNITALAQITAEELDVEFERIRMRPTDTSQILPTRVIPPEAPRSRPAAAPFAMRRQTLALAFWIWLRRKCASLSTASPSMMA